MLSPHLEEPLKRCAEGVTPPNVALMQLFIAARDETEARRALDAAIEAAQAARDNTAAARLIAVLETWRRTAHSYSAIALIHQLAGRELEGSEQDRIHQCAELFDRAASISPEAGVALYSLGDERLLEATTHELVAKMREWALFDRTTDVLDLGCGSGRLLVALAPHVRSITGIDISEAMLRLASARTSHLANASVILSTGRDLSALGNRHFDRIVAVDSFPYLVQAGVAEAHAADCARLLAPDARLLMMNYSYRENTDADRADIARIAQQHNLAIERNGTRDLALWDGVAFLLRKRREAATPSRLLR